MENSPLTNSLAATLRNGDVALGLLDNTYSPTLVEFYGELGLDFIWLDLEHGGPDPWDANVLENLLRAAERNGPISSTIQSGYVEAILWFFTQNEGCSVGNATAVLNVDY